MHIFNSKKHTHTCMHTHRHNHRKGDLKKKWYIHSIDLYLARKKCIGTGAGKWMEVEIILLIKISFTMTSVWKLGGRKTVQQKRRLLRMGIGGLSMIKLCYMHAVRKKG